MPWCETSPMEERMEFVGQYETDLVTMTELAAQYGISPKTGYKWVERYDAEGALGLCDRSRRPHTSHRSQIRTWWMLSSLCGTVIRAGARRSCSPWSVAVIRGPRGRRDRWTPLRRSHRRLGSRVRLDAASQ